ncbi:TetR/AcrR family transcriptional regulator [Streptomyces gobiensis]|uniref:TetR/AcrR family transcriptional regulator n=1 Tax=Streptomyces gobiensis TaxID=2875706 RepID=UPI001E65007B|nr:TetR/AcrR family transcriptional regulator [Streptomyces gobiensis]UGY93532.1 TetR/AcrR family transcriptional regulator [Streptomyces gobiensis]
MPTARESLLTAAQTALDGRPWTTVRMVDVAALAGVSRQTLYNEFGSKEGLGAALVRRRVEIFVEGAAEATSTARRDGADPSVCCASAAVWMLHRAREEPLVRAALTGCWSSRLPLPDGPPERLLERLCDRMVLALAGEGLRIRRACESGLRLALSYVVAPPAEPEAAARVADAVSALLERPAPAAG